MFCIQRTFSKNRQAGKYAWCCSMILLFFVWVHIFFYSYFYAEPSSEGLMRICLFCINTAIKITFQKLSYIIIIWVCIKLEEQLNQIYFWKLKDWSNCSYYFLILEEKEWPYDKAKESNEGCQNSIMLSFYPIYPTILYSKLMITRHFCKQKKFRCIKNSHVELTQNIYFHHRYLNDSTSINMLILFAVKLIINHHIVVWLFTLVTSCSSCFG